MVKRSRRMAFSSSDNEYSPPRPQQHRFSNSVVDSVLKNVLSNSALPSGVHHPLASSSRGILSSSSHSTGLSAMHSKRTSTRSRTASTSLSGAFSQAKMETNRGLKGKARMTGGQKKNVRYLLMESPITFTYLVTLGSTRATKGYEV